MSELLTVDFRLVNYETSDFKVKPVDGFKKFYPNTTARFMKLKLNGVGKFERAAQSFDSDCGFLGFQLILENQQSNDKKST